MTTGALPIAVAPPPKQRILSLRQGSQAMVVCFFRFGEEGEAEKDCGVLSLMESIHTRIHLHLRWRLKPNWYTYINRIVDRVFICTMEESEIWGNLK